MQILVLFCGPNVVKVNVIRAIANQIMNKDTLSRLILIVQNHITSQAMKALDLLPFKVEIFQVGCLLFTVCIYHLCLNILVFGNAWPLSCCCQYACVPSPQGTCEMKELSSKKI